MAIVRAGHRAGAAGLSGGLVEPRGHAALLVLRPPALAVPFVLRGPLLATPDG